MGQIEVRIYDGAKKNDLGAQRVLKCVVSDNAASKRTVTLGPPRGIEHSELIPDGDTLISDECFLQWDSYTCRRDMGYDRPGDPAVAQQIAAEVSAAVLDWLRRVQTHPSPQGV